MEVDRRKKRCDTSLGIAPFGVNLSAFFLIIEHTVAVTLKVGIGDLLAEFLADAFVLLCSRNTAGTVAVLELESLLDSCDDLGIVVKSYLRLAHIIKSSKYP